MSSLEIPCEFPREFPEECEKRLRSRSGLRGARMFSGENCYSVASDTRFADIEGR